MSDLTTDRSGKTLKEYRQLYWDMKAKVDELEGELECLQESFNNLTAELLKLANPTAELSALLEKQEQSE